MAQPKYSRYYTYIKPIVTNRIIRSVAPYIFGLVTIAILTVFAIRPTVSTILNLQKSIEQNQAVLKSLDEKAQNLVAGKKNLDNLDPQVKSKIATLIPIDPEVPQVVASLQNSSLAHASISALQIQPLTLIDNTTSDSKPRLSLGTVEFSYNVQGSFAQLLSTLQNFAQTPRLLGISSVIINKQVEGPAILSVTGKAYFLK